jgi:hypothetical protein
MTHLVSDRTSRTMVCIGEWYREIIVESVMIQSVATHFDTDAAAECQISSATSLGGGPKDRAMPPYRPPHMRNAPPMPKLVLVNRHLVAILARFETMSVRRLLILIIIINVYNYDNHDIVII